MGMMDVRISVSNFAKDAYVLAAEGELDMSTVGPLRELISGLLEDGAQKLLVDLTEVTFVESTSLSALLTATRDLDTSGGRLVIAADDPWVLRAIELSGLDGVLHVEASLPGAIRELVLHGD
jgi:anti-anti-sigma factor